MCTTPRRRSAVPRRAKSNAQIVLAGRYCSSSSGAVDSRMAQQFNAVGLGDRRHDARRGPHTGHGVEVLVFPRPDPETPARSGGLPLGGSRAASSESALPVPDWRIASSFPQGLHAPRLTASGRLDSPAVTVIRSGRAIRRSNRSSSDRNPVTQGSGPEAARGVGGGGAIGQLPGRDRAR